MPSLKDRSIQFLQKRFPRATVLNNEVSLVDPETKNVEKTMYPMIAQDFDSGIKQRLFAVPNLGANGELPNLADCIVSLFETLESSVWVGVKTTLKSKGHGINTGQMVNAPKIILYTDCLYLPYHDVLRIFGEKTILVEVIHEGEMYSTLFISYGGPDEEYVATIVKYLKNHGIQTWFFPDNALPGQKLHRVMHEQINNHDRVLLVCSEHSLSRLGVLNEIERVLEREAREGGKEILIPITLDDHVYQDWAQDRPDLAQQIRSRVITKFPKVMDENDEFSQAAEKLLEALKR